MQRYERRIWGWYYVLLNRRHFKVKLLCFLPNGACSKQYHHHRNELWLFLKGYGHLNREAIGAGEFAMIHANHQHQYIAMKKTYVLEIQYGAKCEESDIVRV